MPRDDLSIDFVKTMPQTETLDPAMILDDWINRVANLPEEIRFVQDEIADKDRQYTECIKAIEDRDGRIQKWIKANGSHENNPREDGYRQFIRDNYAKADQLSLDKIALTQKLQAIMDKHLRQLDMQIKTLFDRGEPGFTDPDEVPSLLRGSAANQSVPPARSLVHAATASPAPAPPKPVVSSATPAAAATTATAAATVVAAARPANPQIRTAQTHQTHPASAPATPAASMILSGRVRESSAGPGSGAPKRGPRVNLGLGAIPTTSSGLARHSSLGPGTPKAHTAAGVQRAGSAGPRATTKGAGSGPGRKAGTPSAVGIGGRKKGTPVPTSKSSLSRVKRPAKNSPSSTADSELSEAESASESATSSRRGTPARGSGGGGGGTGTGTGTGSGPSQNATAREAHQTQPPQQQSKREKGSNKTKDDDDDAMDVDEDEAGDDKKYCLCQNVSFGDMVACDNTACPFEWFHWSCVGLKSEPNGTWYCPVCAEKMSGIIKKRT